MEKILLMSLFHIFNINADDQPDCTSLKSKSKIIKDERHAEFK
jgi:hypothetical protein